MTIRILLIVSLASAASIWIVGVSLITIMVGYLMFSSNNVCTPCVYHGQYLFIKLAGFQSL